MDTQAPEAQGEGAAQSLMLRRVSVRSISSEHMPVNTLIFSRTAAGLSVTSLHTPTSTIC